MRSRVLGLSLVILLIAAPAWAASFTLSSLKVDLNQWSPGLKWTNLIDGGLTFDLADAGQTYTVGLFRLTTPESSANLRSLVPHTIDVRLGLTSPASGVANLGLSGASSFLQGYGHLVWNNPVQVSFGNGGLLAMSLSNATYEMPGSAVISATFSLLQRPVQVPEPVSAALAVWGCGILAILRVRRARA